MSTGTRPRHRRRSRRRLARRRTFRTAPASRVDGTRSATRALTVESCNPTATPQTATPTSTIETSGREHQSRHHGHQYRERQQHSPAQPVVRPTGGERSDCAGGHRECVDDRNRAGRGEVVVDEVESDEPEAHQARRGQPRGAGEPVERSRQAGCGDRDRGRAGDGRRAPVVVDGGRRCARTMTSTTIAAAPGIARIASAGQIDAVTATVAATIRGPANAPTWSNALCTPNPRPRPTSPSRDSQQRRLRRAANGLAGPLGRGSASTRRPVRRCR